MPSCHIKKRPSKFWTPIIFFLFNVTMMAIGIHLTAIQTFVSMKATYTYDALDFDMFVQNSVVELQLNLTPLAKSFHIKFQPAMGVQKGEVIIIYLTRKHYKIVYGIFTVM